MLAGLATPVSTPRAAPGRTVLSRSNLRRVGGWVSRPAGMRRARDERGAIALEAALVTVLLFTIVAGIVDCSMYFRTSYEVSSAARAGARIASADPLSTTFARTAALQVTSAMEDLDMTRVTQLWVYKADPTTGVPTSGASCTSSCVKFTVSAAGVPSAGTGSWTGRQACAGGTVDAVGVYLEYRNDAPIQFLENKLIGERTVMRLEQVPSTLACVSS